MDLESYLCPYCMMTVNVPHWGVDSIQSHIVGCPGCGFPYNLTFYPNFMHVDYYKVYKEE